MNRDEHAAQCDTIYVFTAEREEQQQQQIIRWLNLVHITAVIIVAHARLHADRFISFVIDTRNRAHPQTLNTKHLLTT